MSYDEAQAKADSAHEEWVTDQAVKEAFEACAELARAAGCLCDSLADGDARWADCGSCQGRGYAAPSPSVACAICHGQGTVVENHDHRCPAAILAAIESRGRA